MKKNQETIESLRKKGFKVRVIHRDWVHSDREHTNTDLLSRDGQPCVTQIDVTYPDGTDKTGFAFRAKGDQYDRKFGNQIALGRALCKRN